MTRLLSIVALLLLTCGTQLRAHALDPGYVQITSVAPDTYSILWKIPGLPSGPMPISLRLPETCADPAPPPPQPAGTGFVAMWTTTCPGGLSGLSLRIEGLEGTVTDVLARIEAVPGQVETHRFTPEETEITIVGKQSLAQVAGAYFLLGVEHILGGPDHLLFVAALLLLVEGWRRLVATITAFTLAHSITLAASTLGVISVPVPPVEALIALSIAYVAAEVVHRARGQRSLTAERPWIIAFTFGLLHGLGFASALAGIGLPQGSVTTALLFFNLGVEAGQLLFVACLLFIVWIADRLSRHALSQRAEILRLPPAYAIGTMAMFWVAERISGF